MGVLDGKVACVTGAAQGIGQAFAQALAREGAAVSVADIRSASKTVADITAAGGRAIEIRTDVADEASCERMVAETAKAFGRLDILIANAGAFAEIPYKPFEQISAEEWDHVMAVNVRGVWLSCKSACGLMRKTGYGKMVLMSSSRAFGGAVDFLHYDASKGAVVAIARSLSREVGEHGIRVNAIAPGLTLSDGVKAGGNWPEKALQNRVAARTIKRIEVPEDLVGTMLYLASPASDFVTGQTLVVDGGQYMW